MVWYGLESTQYNVSIELAFKKYSKKTPQVLKSSSSKVTFLVIEVIESQQSVESTQYSVNIEFN